eukprot:TRINITY_DN95452_c0_g1_i1.p1 TRINITY_DN95452_c0_g1~~TRINITY_DN95452_c0_g1_i1.p1  ORF type:complete len:135 (-),score=6.28 TRINITY_DN95452_c0_g1_i1:195-599(-)
MDSAHSSSGSTPTKVIATLDPGYTDASRSTKKSHLGAQRCSSWIYFGNYQLLWSCLCTGALRVFSYAIVHADTGNQLQPVTTPVLAEQFSDFELGGLLVSTLPLPHCRQHGSWAAAAGTDTAYCDLQRITKYSK